MRRSEATRYARWAAIVAVVLTCVVIGVYVYRAVEARRIARKAPPVVPPTVEKRSDSISFSKLDGERTIFTVRASRSTEFKEGGKALLDDVWITIYGRSGKRYDNIHSRQCDYFSSTGRVTCSGEVQMDLESAAEARANPGQRSIHIGTSDVSFDRESGVASTKNPVVFRFPYGHGRGTGATYLSREAVFRIGRDVELTLTANERGDALAQPVTLTSGGLAYERETRTLRLLAPVRVRQGARELVAGLVALEFDGELRARRLTASGSPRLESKEPQGEFYLTAEKFETLFHPGGWAERISAVHGVNGRLKNANGKQQLRAHQLELLLEPQTGYAREVGASGGVTLEVSERGGARKLDAPALRFLLAAGARPKDRRIVSGETLGASTLVLVAGDDTTAVRAEKFFARFDDGNILQQLDGSGGVSVERRLTGRPAQTSTSRELTVRFGAGGEWSQVTQADRVKFREGNRTAEAERGVLERATDTLTLSGGATVVDSQSRTTAATLSFQQRSGEVRGSGGVRTTYVTSGRDAAINLAPQPAHVSADRLFANRDSGRAVYSGQARLWQGDAVIEAEEMELFRADRKLEARGRVQALLPQNDSTASAKDTKSGTVMWRIRAARLAYWSLESRAKLEEDAWAQSRLGEIRARSIELFFSAPGGGAQQLARGVATGGVTVLASSGPDQRRGFGERAEYIAAEGKFVLSGGKPTLFDPILGSTTGRQLTFFSADDKILVESEEGFRTLSRHRVEK